MKTFNLISEVFFLSSYPYYFCDSRFDAKLHFFFHVLVHGYKERREKVIKKNLGERKCVVKNILATKKADICINEFILSRKV
jgi:hypothetical protein